MLLHKQLEQLMVVLYVCALFESISHLILNSMPL